MLIEHDKWNDEGGSQKVADLVSPRVTHGPAISLEVKSALPAQVQLVRSTDSFVYNWLTKTWVNITTLPSAGLAVMTPSADVNKSGWYWLVVPINSTIPDGIYKAVFYGVGGGGPKMLCDRAFGVVSGTPYTDGILAVPPSATAIAVRVLESSVVAHNNVGTVGALYNQLQALVTRLNTYLTKVGA